MGFALAFAVTASVWTDGFGSSNLGVCIRFQLLKEEPSTPCFSFLLLTHSLVIDLQSGKSLFPTLSKFMIAKSPSWKGRLIGLFTDGAPNMAGLVQGFKTRLTNFVSNSAFYWIWYLAHQPDIIAKNGTLRFADMVQFLFMQMLTTTVVWLRLQAMIIRRLKAKCPYMITVRWISVAKVLKWLIAHRSVLVDILDEKGYAVVPNNVWWLTAMAVLVFFYPVITALETLQIRVIVEEGSKPVWSVYHKLSSFICKLYTTREKIFMKSKWSLTPRSQQSTDD